MISLTLLRNGENSTPGTERLKAQVEDWRSAGLYQTIPHSFSLTAQFSGDGALLLNARNIGIGLMTLR